MSSFNPDLQAKNINSKIVVALEKLSEVFRVLLWKEAKKQELSPIQLQLLVFLKYHTDAIHGKVASLAREFNLSKATISDSVKLLVRKRLIRRMPDSNDGRSPTLTLTSKGKSLADAIEHFIAPLDHAVSELSAAQKEFLLFASLDLLDQLSSQGIISNQRMCFRCAFYKGDKKHYHSCSFFKKVMFPNELRIDCPAFKGG